MSEFSAAAALAATAKSASDAADREVNAAPPAPPPAHAIASDDDRADRAADIANIADIADFALLSVPTFNPIMAAFALIGIGTGGARHADQRLVIENAACQPHARSAFRLAKLLRLISLLSCTHLAGPST